ncbi:aldo/keto reductase [Aestuariivirga sp.]|uniref:aldo/keto reductase n=1 Tax=Aestuariivirga sp. TaxID=2650926 RepID=UPI0039E26900
MEYRTLGRSGLKVSVLSLGSANFGAEGDWGKVWGKVGVDGVERQIDISLDHGVNLIDTANVYSASKSESLIGEVLAKGRRNRLLISSKVRFPVGDGPNDRGLSRYHLVREAENSLKRLRTDVIDIYQVHEWDGQTPLEETIEALDTLVRHGKVRYIGCSNYSAWHLMKALSISDSTHRQRFVCQQIHYSLQAREAEYELIPLGFDQGVSLLVWSPLAGGWLSGKYTRNSAPDTGRQAIGFREPPIYDWNKLWNIVDVLNDVAARHKATASQVAIAWLLQRPMVASVIMGGRSTEQIESNLKAASLSLSADDVAQLDKVSEPNLLYPYWHQAYTASDRVGTADLTLLKPYLGRDLTAPRT